MMIATNARTRRKAKAEHAWPRKVQPGRAIVRVYRRKTPAGYFSFMVANHDGNCRRFDCYKNEADAVEAANTLAKRLDRRDFVAASLTQSQAIEYADANAALAPFAVTVRDATNVVARCLKLTGDLSAFEPAIKSHLARQKKITKKSMADAVAEFLKVRKGRGVSDRYLSDLKGRLERFADDCMKDVGDVTTANVQDWLDRQIFAPQNYKNFRTVLFTFFKFAVSRGFASDNPVDGVEKIKVRDGDVEIFTPSEIARLLSATTPEFLPCVAIGAFAGLRSAEIERLEWSDIHLTEKFIVVGASKAKTAGRRIVPIHDNLAEWLRDYSEKVGKVWSGTHDEFYEAQQATARATANEEKPAVKWKANGLRHSYASYRFAQIGDAGRVAGELGNSAGVVHKHYRELVKPSDAEKWFNVKPDVPENVVVLATGA